MALPSFPATDKKKNPRYKWFRANYGDRCWELDAMDPNDLRACVEEGDQKLIEPVAWERCEVVNRAERESLRSILDEVDANMNKPDLIAGALRDALLFVLVLGAVTLALAVDVERAGRLAAEPMAMMSPALFTSTTDEWPTPRAFFAKLNRRYQFTLDPCATAENATCALYFTKEDDGLKQDWGSHRVFCNPPMAGCRRMGAQVLRGITGRGAGRAARPRPHRYPMVSRMGAGQGRR